MRPHRYKLHLLDIGDHVIITGTYTRAFHVQVSTAAANYARSMKSKEDTMVSFKTSRKRPDEKDPREGIMIKRVVFRPRKRRPRKPKP